jgi:hypothetical protein
MSRKTVLPFLLLMLGFATWDAFLGPTEGDGQGRATFAEGGIPRPL